MSGSWERWILVFMLVGIATACANSGSQATPTATREPTATPANPATTPAALPPRTTTGEPSTTPVNMATTPAALPATEPPAGPMVNIGGATFTVEVVDNPEARAQGLSGRTSLPPSAGMLFVFEDKGIHTFWMKDMMFPLDLVWIGEQCEVISITANISPPMPEQADSDLPRFRPPQPIRYVLEINVGEAAEANIQPGDRAGFAGSLRGSFGC